MKLIRDYSIHRLFGKVSELFEKTRKLEGRMASDFDLKLSDTLRYYTNDTRAALDLLYRRSRALANFEHSNKVSRRTKIMKILSMRVHLDMLYIFTVLAHHIHHLSHLLSFEPSWCT